MRRSVVLLTVVLLGLAVPSNAGVEPSPFDEWIGDLGSVENNFRTLVREVARILADPPEPGMPHGDLIGVLGRISAMDHKVQVLDGRLTDIMDAVGAQHMETSSEPLLPVIRAAGDVQDQAQMMYDAIGMFIETTPPDQIPGDFSDALQALRIRVGPVALKLDIDHYFSHVKRTIPVRFVQHLDVLPSAALTEQQLQDALARANDIFRRAGIQLVMSYNIVVPGSWFRTLFWSWEPDEHKPYFWPDDPSTSEAVWPLLLPDRTDCPELFIPDPSPLQRFKETSYDAQMRAGTYCGRPEEILVYINQGISNGGQYPWYSRIIGMTRDHMLSDVFAHEVGHYLGLPHTFSGLHVYGLDYNFGRFVGAADGIDPTAIRRYYEPTDRILDVETKAIAPFSMFWDLVFSTGLGLGPIFFDSRAEAADYEETLQPIEQWHPTASCLADDDLRCPNNSVVCDQGDPFCSPSRVKRLKISVAAGCTGSDGSTSNCAFPAVDFYTGAPEVKAFSRFGSTPDQIRWNIMSYGYGWADPNKTGPIGLESQFISESQIEQIKRVLRCGNDVETYYFAGQCGRRPDLGLCQRCHQRCSPTEPCGEELPD